MLLLRVFLIVALFVALLIATDDGTQRCYSRDVAVGFSCEWGP